MKTVFCSYSDKKYKDRQQRLLLHSLTSGFDKGFAYERDWLITTDFYKENAKILDQERGAGYWLWKPYIILETFKQIDDGDIVFYLDCGDWFEGPVKHFIVEKCKETDIILTNGHNLNKHWTKRDCFILMGCDALPYWESYQLEAGILVFKKSQTSIDILNKWLEYCKNEHILTDLAPVCGEPNIPGFQDHRHDQSILTNLKVKYNLYASHEMRRFVTCNIV